MNRMRAATIASLLIFGLLAVPVSASDPRSPCDGYANEIQTTAFYVAAGTTQLLAQSTAIKATTVTVAGTLATKDADAGQDAPSLCIDAEKITVIGSIVTGNGQRGDSVYDAVTAQGSNGTNGGDLVLGLVDRSATIATPSLRILPGGVLRTGDGGAGGAAVAWPQRFDASVTTQGGRGGDAGLLSLSYGGWPLSVAPATIHLGTGGDGGNALTVGSPRADYFASAGAAGSSDMLLNGVLVAEAAPSTISAVVAMLAASSGGHGGSASAMPPATTSSRVCAPDTSVCLTATIGDCRSLGVPSSICSADCAGLGIPSAICDAGLCSIVPEACSCNAMCYVEILCHTPVPELCLKDEIGPCDSVLDTFQPSPDNATWCVVDFVRRSCDFVLDNTAGPPTNTQRYMTCRGLNNVTQPLGPLFGSNGQDDSDTPAGPATGNNGGNGTDGDDGSGGEIGCSGGTDGFGCNASASCDFWAHGATDGFWAEGGYTGADGVAKGTKGGYGILLGGTGGSAYAKGANGGTGGTGGNGGNGAANWFCGRAYPGATGGKGGHGGKGGAAFATGGNGGDGIVQGGKGGDHTAVGGNGGTGGDGGNGGAGEISTQPYTDLPTIAPPGAWGCGGDAGDHGGAVADGGEGGRNLNGAGPLEGPAGAWTAASGGPGTPGHHGTTFKEQPTPCAH